MNQAFLGAYKNWYLLTSEPIRFSIVENFYIGHKICYLSTMPPLHIGGDVSSFIHVAIADMLKIAYNTNIHVNII